MKITPIILLIISSFTIHLPILARNDSISSQMKDREPYTKHDIRIGERIFHGFVSTTASTINCASCHNVGRVDTFNWNPSAYELALKYRNRDFNAFKGAITQPTGQVMQRIHENLILNDEQIHQIRGFLIDLSIKGEQPLKPLRTNRIIFTILVVIFVLSFIDLVFTRRIPYRIIHIALLGITALLITRYTVRSAIDLGRSPDYQPDQPIKFSHKVHAGQNQTDCLYCHFNAEESKFAGIPPANVCNNCHVLVKEGSRSGRFEIAKIYHALETNKSIEWVKVYNVPDHVYFNHSQHVSAGKIDCMTCHGDVASMDEVVQVNDLSMGWCIECHRDTEVQFDNRFYGKYEQLHKDLREGKIDKVSVEQIGGLDCMKCHY
jgi:cytochrome c553